MISASSTNSTPPAARHGRRVWPAATHAVLACLAGLLTFVVVASVGAAPADFTIIGIPDTQMYTGELNGGVVGMFNAQMEWIRDNRQRLNIVHVAHLGDCVQHGNSTTEWNRFDSGMNDIEDPAATGLPQGITYGIAVGNHDQSPTGDPSGTSTKLFNQYFGVSRFSGRSYYGGHYGSNNDNHYMLFSAGGEDFIAIYMEYNSSASTSDAEFGWAANLLRTYPNRRGIVVRHELISSNGDWRSQGSTTYNALKSNPNLFMMLCGHLTGEGKRTDTYNGSTVYTILTDYQGRTHGGDGYLRIYTFSPANHEIRVQTYSPWLDKYETDSNSQFTLPYTPRTPTTYTITASAGSHGAISPSGSVAVAGGDSQSFTISPDTGYMVASVSVDGTSIGPVSSYTFNAVSANHTISATFTSAPSNNDVVIFQQAVNGTSTNSSSVSTSSVSGVAGNLYVAAVSTRDFVEPTSVSGLGMAWTLVRSQCTGRGNTGVALYVAQGVPSGSGSVRADFPNSPLSATIIVARYSGASTVSPIGALVSGNTRGVSGSCSGGSDTNSYSLPLTTTTPGALVFGAATMRDATHSPGSSYTERLEKRATSSSSTASSVAIMDRTVTTPGSVAVNGSFSKSVDWAVIGIEIRPSVATPTIPDITVTPATYDFGTLAVGASTTKQFVIRNDGDADLSVSSLSLQGSDSAQFGIDSGGGAAVLSPGQTRNVVVHFAPTSSGAKSATLRIPSNDPDENPFNVALTGSGVTQAPDITVTPTSYSFGAVTPPASAQHSFQVGNSGNANLTVTAIQIVGGDASVFSLGSLSLPWTVTPGTNKSVTVTFKPTDTAPRSTTLRITSNDPDAATVDVGLAGGASAEVAFGEVQSGSSLLSGTVTTSAALTARAGDLYLAAIAAKPHREASSVVGLGLQWSRLGAQCAGRSQTGVDLWMATGTPTSDGTVTASFSSSPSSAAIVVSRYSSTSGGLGVVVSANSNGLSGSCSGGTDGATYSVPMGTSVPNARIYAAIGLRNKAHTPGGGFVERIEMNSGGSAGSAAGLAVVDQTFASMGNVNVVGSFSSSVDWAVVAVEIQPVGVTKTASGQRLAAKSPAVANVPRQVVLGSAPNPFNPSTTIQFGLPEARSVRLSIYDITGRRVRVLLDERREAGMHDVLWTGVDASGRQVASGIYFAVLQAGETNRTLKLLLAK